jgi:hypothetical protein
MRLLTLKNDTRKEAIGVFVSNYFTNTLNLYGMTARGADWRDDDAQTLRFEQLLKILPAQSDSVQTFTLVDYGCGYGAFLEAFRQKQNKSKLSRYRLHKSHGRDQQRLF